MSLMRSSRRSRSPILGRPTYSLSSSDGSPTKTAKSSSPFFSCFARTGSAPSRLMPFMPPKIAILIANPSLMTGAGGPQTLDTLLVDEHVFHGAEEPAASNRRARDRVTQHEAPNPHLDFGVPDTGPRRGRAGKPWIQPEDGGTP